MSAFAQQVVTLYPTDHMELDLPPVSRLAHLRNAFARQRPTFLFRIVVQADAPVPVTLTIEADARTSFSERAV